MKKLIFYCSIVFLACSCENEHPQTGNIVGRWELVEVYNPWTGTTSTEGVEDNLQTYQFMSNGTFKKTRVFDENERKEASGIYLTEKVPAYSSSNAKLYVNLTYTAGESIASNCGEPDAEQLVLRFSNRLDNFSATPCDGPGYSFAKK
ncbi:hypothetical protein JYB64_08075 [Algoriphagus aestuarii]|nr:hypothetical protein [Algoriphagus aestuarii]